ncbi:hypothetical protein SHIRM173S_06159 [Streptomyces hirsutus]
MAGPDPHEVEERPSAWASEGFTAHVQPWGRSPQPRPWSCGPRSPPPSRGAALSPLPASGCRQEHRADSSPRTVGVTRDDESGAHRSGPDPGPRRRIADPGRPPAHPLPHRPAARRLRRRSTDRRRRPRAAPGAGVLTAGVAGRRRDPLRRRARAEPGKAEGTHPPRRRQADLDRSTGHLDPRRTPRRTVAGHVPAGGHHDRRDPRALSGPTVVGPLLSFVRPKDRLQHLLVWEGSLIDPVGGILGARSSMRSRPSSTTDPAP